MMKIAKLKQKLIFGVSALLGACLITLLLAGTNPLEKWQLKLTNRLYQPGEASEDIVIVGIDENSIDSEGLGRYFDWPRSHYAQVIQNLEDAGAQTIGLDFFFVTKSKGISEESLIEIITDNPTLREYYEQTFAYLEDPHPEDEVLAEAFKENDNIILGSRLISTEKYTATEIEFLDKFKTNTIPASLIFYPDQDDIFRRIPVKLTNTEGGENFYAFSRVIASQYLADENPNQVDEELDQSQQLLINYQVGPQGYNHISFEDIYYGDFEKSDIEGKIVLVGATTEQLSDHAITPIAEDIPMPGVELHANAIQTILEGNWLHEQSVGSQTLVTTLLAAGLIAGLLLLGIIPGLMLTTGLIIAYHLSAQLFFNQGLIINLVYPTLVLLLTYLATTLFKYISETREKQQLKGAFSKYVNKDLVNQIMENPDLLQLGGAKKTITVFFSDIESFTSFSEKVTPEELVSQLNEYFEVMAAIIMKNNGTLNKYDGDAIMAFWGAPLDNPQHAINAAQSALECRHALGQLHQKWQTEGKPLLNFRVGLSTGDAIAGNVGSNERFDYTVMGDIVNLGSRLEGANKQYGTRAMISDATLAALGDTFEVRRLDRLRVKGKEQPVDVYELLAAKGTISPEQQQFINEFHQAIEYYRNGKFQDAKARFEQLKAKAANDGPTQVYIERCEHFIANPPTEGWDGTWTLDHK
jgi:adenylate cyclase